MCPLLQSRSDDPEFPVPEAPFVSENLAHVSLSP
jgi:hypothetical protein